MAMSTSCIICNRPEPAHPTVGGGYVPHAFEPADRITVPGYTGPDRRKLVRRMDDRIALVERRYSAAYR